MRRRQNRDTEAAWATIQLYFVKIGSNEQVETKSAKTELNTTHRNINKRKAVKDTMAEKNLEDYFVSSLAVFNLKFGLMNVNTINHFHISSSYY
jgi:hypothetical protein